MSATSCIPREYAASTVSGRSASSNRSSTRRCARRTFSELRRGSRTDRVLRAYCVHTAALVRHHAKRERTSSSLSGRRSPSSSISLRRTKDSAEAAQGRRLARAFVRGGQDLAPLYVQVDTIDRRTSPKLLRSPSTGSLAGAYDAESKLSRSCGHRAPQRVGMAAQPQPQQ